MEFLNQKPVQGFDRLGKEREHGTGFHLDRFAVDGNHHRVPSTEIVIAEIQGEQVPPQRDDHRYNNFQCQKRRGAASSSRGTSGCQPAAAALDTSTASEHKRLSRASNCPLRLKSALS